MLSSLSLYKVGSGDNCPKSMLCDEKSTIKEGIRVINVMD